MNTPGLINFFASNGYLIDQAALSYVKAHDHKELLELFKEYNPELIVIDLPSIRKVKRTARSNVITLYIRAFKPRPLLIHKDKSFFERVRDNLNLHHHGGMEK